LVLLADAVYTATPDLSHRHAGGHAPRGRVTGLRSVTLARNSRLPVAHVTGGAVRDELETVSDREPIPALDGHGSAAPYGEIERLTELVAGLKVALLTRDIIGQAKGILMERYRITADEAFDLLRTVSQHKNRKVRDLAEELASTGSWEPSG